MVLSAPISFIRLFDTFSICTLLSPPNDDMSSILSSAKLKLWRFVSPANGATLDKSLLLLRSSTVSALNPDNGERSVTLLTSHSPPPKYSSVNLVRPLNGPISVILLSLKNRVCKLVSFSMPLTSVMRGDSHEQLKFVISAYDCNSLVKMTLSIHASKLGSANGAAGLIGSRLNAALYTCPGRSAGTSNCPR